MFSTKNGGKIMHKFTTLGLFLTIFPYILLRCIGIKITIGKKCSCNSRLSLSIRIITFTFHHIFSHPDGDLEETWQDKQHIFLCIKCGSIKKQKYGDLVKIKMQRIKAYHEEEK